MFQLKILLLNIKVKNFGNYSLNIPLDGVVSQENATTATEVPKTAIEEEKNGASAANPVATEEKKPEEPQQPMEVEKEGKKEEENYKMEEIKEETAAKLDKAQSNPII